VAYFAAKDLCNPADSIDGASQYTGPSPPKAAAQDDKSEGRWTIGRMRQRSEVRGLLLCYHRYESHPTVVMNRAIIRSLQDFDEDDEIPVISGRGEGIMEEAPATGSGAARRNEDIALDLMKFVAMTTGYGRTTSTGVGFTGSGSAAKPEDYAEKLLELYGRCLGAVGGKK